MQRNCVTLSYPQTNHFYANKKIAKIFKRLEEFGSKYQKKNNFSSKYIPEITKRGLILKDFPQ